MTAPIGTQHLGGIPIRDIAVRFAFGAGVSVLSGIVGLVAGQRAGGLLLAFPAILPAALTLIEKKEGTSSAIADVRGACVGAIGLIGFALSSMLLAERLPTLLALAIAAAAWTVVSLGLYFAGIGLAGLLHEQQYLPDVAAAEAEPVVTALRRGHLTIGVAESCTGGALAALLTAVPHASDAVAGGVVAYTNEAKQRLLDIDPGVLEHHGAISEPCARSMAGGARERFHADVGVGITGVIGSPLDGIQPGTMFIAAVGPRGARARELHSQGSPETCRADALRTALELVQEVIEQSLR